MNVRRLGIWDAFAGLLALASAGYAIATAPQKGVDILFYQEAGKFWASNIYRLGEGTNGMYLPFSLVLFTPFSWLSFEKLRIVWLGVNVAATALLLFATLQWVGKDWPFKARFYLCALFLCWAPFRVTLRNGQISLVITLLILGVIFARQHGRPYLAGALLGISLCKYPMTFPFLPYFLWKREWKLMASTVLIPFLLTEVFLFQTGKSHWEAGLEYARSIAGTYAFPGEYIGSSEIKPLIYGLTGGNASLSVIITLTLSLVALGFMAIAFVRRPQQENLHLAILALFALWVVYHRTYDSVLCIIPAALLMDFFVKRKFVRLSVCGLSGLSLLAISIPGLLTERLGFTENQLSSHLFGFLGLHIERIMTLGVFCIFLFILWRVDTSGAFVCEGHETGFVHRFDTEPPVNSPPRTCRILRGYQSRMFRRMVW
jgi:hypothetical protein